MCIKKIMEWLIPGLLIIGVTILFSMAIKSCLQDPNIKFGEHVQLIEGCRHLKFYDECNGYVEKYKGEGRYMVDATCTTIHIRDGLEVVLISTHTLRVNKKCLKVLD